MKLLALETAMEACSCALYLDGEISVRHTVAPRRHAELVLPFAEALLEEAGIGLADLDGIAFGRGPGAFTGLRIGAGVAQGLAFGADLPVAPVSSLRAIAQGVLRERGAPRIAVAVDARMGEVYWGCFEAAQGALVAGRGAEQVCAPGAVQAPPGAWFGAGTGWEAHREALTARVEVAPPDIEPDRLPHARDVAVLGAAALAAGKGVAAVLARPVYLRDRVAEPPRARRPR